MSEGLEALERIKKAPTSYREEKPRFAHTYFQDLGIIEKELKAIEIIKNYGYFDEQGDLIVHLPTNRKEENGLLKEVLL